MSARSFNAFGASAKFTLVWKASMRKESSSRAPRGAARDSAQATSLPPRPGLTDCLGKAGASASCVLSWAPRGSSGARPRRPPRRPASSSHE